jgi:hypothetical protein
VPPTELRVHIVWRNAPPTPAQCAAWRQLWQRILSPVDLTATGELGAIESVTRNDEAREAGISRASADLNASCADQAAATAYDAPNQRSNNDDRV